MWNWKQIATAALVVALTVVIVWRFVSPGEPSYKGKPLSFWLTAYQTQDGYQRIPLERLAMQHQADIAVGQAGTNAIPLLLRLIRAKDSALKTKLISLWERQRIIKIEFTRAAELNYQGWAGFHRLGLGAKEILPVLVEVADQTPSPSRFAVAEVGCIAQSDREAIPVLERWATNVDEYARYEAILALGRLSLGPVDESKRVVPILTNALSDWSYIVRNGAIQYLGMFGTNATSAVPAILEFLKTPQDQSNLSNASNALKEIDPELAVRMGIE